MNSRFVILALVWLSFLIVPCTTQGAIQFRDATKDVENSASALTANKPAGTTAGDLLVAWATHDVSGGTWTPPPGQGWIAFSLPGTESSFTSRAWYKQVDASDASRTDYTFTFSSSNDAILYLAAFYEDTGTGDWALEDGTGWAFDSSDNSLSNGGVTAIDNSLFVVGYANDDNEVVTTDPGGPTKIDEDSVSSLAFAAYYEMVDAIDGSVSYPITWGGGADQLSAMAAIFSWTSSTTANLALTKTDSADPVSTGSSFTYNILVTNNGPLDATNVALVDTLPAGIDWQTATPSQGSCAHSGEPLGGTVTCTLGTIANGAAATVELEVNAPTTTGVISNSATVSADEPDPDASDNTAIEETIIGGADLSLSQSDSPDPVSVNQALSYSLIIDNQGPDDATDVVLVDTLPATVIFQSAISSQGICSESGGTVTCDLGMINDAANATVDIIVTAPPSAGSITNNAVVSTSASDLDSANDTASETTTVQNLNTNQLCYLVADAGGGGGGNDLLTQIDTADFDALTNETNIGIGTNTNSIEAIAWNSATMALYGANGGQLGILSTTTGVFAPSPQAFGTGSGAFGNISFTDVDGLTYDATSGILYGVEAESGTDVLIQIDMTTGAHVPNAFGLGLDYVPLPQIGGNHITDDIAVDPTTGVMYATVNSGGSTDRLIRINKATGVTTDVALITVPDIEGLGTDPTGQLWGTSGTQRILYELNKTTGVGSNGRPIDNGSDYESVDCYAFSPSVFADLAVTKVVNDAAPAEGATATYTVTATNTGPGIATVVQLSDVLPAGVTFASAVASQGTYDSMSGAWFVGTLSAGSNATLNLQASVDIGSAGSTITNTASVTFLSQHDSNAGNDVASADIVPVALPASLLILKSVSTVRDPLGATAPAALAIPGAVVQYEVSVSNSGSGAATETIITDTLNSNLTFLAGEFDGGAADIEIIVGAAAPVYCIAEVGGDTNTDGCFLSAAGDDLTVTIPVSASYPNGLVVGATAPDNVVVVHFRATVN